MGSFGRTAVISRKTSHERDRLRLGLEFDNNVWGSANARELDSILRRSTMKLTFVESLVFTARWHKRLDDAALKALQEELLESPNAGDPIPGCGILRKLRFGDESRGKGKRGGVRVIYLHTPAASRIDLITVYGKDEADDLSKDEVSALCKLAELLRAEATKAAQSTRSTTTPKRRRKD